MIKVIDEETKQVVIKSEKALIQFSQDSKLNIEDFTPEQLKNAKELVPLL